MKIGVVVFCIIYCCSFAAYSQNIKPFSITYVRYPSIEDYAAMFDEIYTELGFKVTLIPTPSLRGLHLLNNGEVDADVLRISYEAKKRPNIIIVQPELGNTDLTLLCVKHIPCSRDTLGNKKITILASKRIISLLDEGEFTAQQANSEVFTTIPHMLKANRYQYALFLMDDLLNSKFSKDFQLVKIKSISINHLIHSKHLALLPKIQEKLRAKLPEFKRNRALKALL